MRRAKAGRLGLGLAVALAATFAVSARAAGPVPSTLEVIEDGKNDPFYLSIGIVTAAKPVCRADRKVKFLVKRTGGGTELLDVARTSDNGGWYSIVPLADYQEGSVDGTIYKLAAKRIVKGKKKIKCGADKVVPS